MNKKFSFDQIQTMDDTQKVDFKPCKTQYEMIMSKDFYKAFEKVLKLMGMYSEEEIQDFMRILTKIRSSEDLLHKERMRFHELLDNPKFQEIGNKFVENLLKRMTDFIRYFYGKDFEKQYFKEDLEKNLSVQKLIGTIKTAIEQTFLTPQQMKKLASLSGIKNGEGNIAGMFMPFIQGGLLYGKTGLISPLLSVIAKEKGDCIELFSCLHQVVKGKDIMGEYYNDMLAKAICASNKKIVRYLLQHVKGRPKIAIVEENIDPDIKAALVEYELLEVKKDEETK